MKTKSIESLIDKAEKRLGKRNAWKSAYSLREEGEHTQKNVAPWLKLIAHEEFYTKENHREKQKVNRFHFSEKNNTSYAQRMADCALPDPFTGNPKYCRVRQCPICQWRRSLKWQARSFRTLGSVIKENPSNKYAILTLTDKNCEVESLRESLGKLNSAWVRMSKRQEVDRVLDGYVRASEVTHGAFGTAHPHLHIILSLKPSFIGKLYIKQQRWGELWGESLKVNYTPATHFSLFKATDYSDTISKIVNSIAYVTKESEVTYDRDWFVAMATQVHHTRAISLGGVFKKHMKDAMMQKDLLLEPTLAASPPPPRIASPHDDMKDIGVKNISNEVVRLGIDKTIKKKPKKRNSRKVIDFEIR